MENENIKDLGIQFQTLSNSVWCYEFKKPTWMIDEKEAIEIVSEINGKNKVIKLIKQFDNINVLIGYVTIAKLNWNEEYLIANERLASHTNSWDEDGELYYLSEIVIAKGYRKQDGYDHLDELLSLVDEYINQINIKKLYISCISDSSKRLMKRNYKDYKTSMLSISGEREVWVITKKAESDKKNDTRIANKLKMTNVSELTEVFRTIYNKDDEIVEGHGNTSVLIPQYSYITSCTKVPDGTWVEYKCYQSQDEPEYEMGKIYEEEFISDELLMKLIKENDINLEELL